MVGGNGYSTPEFLNFQHSIGGKCLPDCLTTKFIFLMDLLSRMINWDLLWAVPDLEMVNLVILLISVW